MSYMSNGVLMFVVCVGAEHQGDGKHESSDKQG